MSLSKLTLTFDKYMADPTGKQAEFSVTINGSAGTINSISLNADPTKFDLLLSDLIEHSDSVNISYTKGTVASANGPLLESFTSAVQNLVPDFGTYELLADITVSTATTTVDITGLNIDKDDEILLVSDIVDGTTTGCSVSIYPNNNTTATNYYRQQLYAASTSVFGARANNAEYAYCDPNDKILGMVRIKLTNTGYFAWQSSHVYTYDEADVQLLERYGTSTFTMSGVTSLRIASVETNGLGIGSRFQLYRTGGA